MMKRITLRNMALCVFAAMLALSGGCDDYDDSGLKKSINDLKERIEALETQVAQLNKDIASVSTIVTALESKVYVAKVEETDKGCEIYFTDNTKVVITNGKDGADGSDGQDGAAGKDAPVIGVKKDTDGVYYWTVTTGTNTEWLTDNGAKLRVTGESVKPVLAVDAEGFWTVSYDGGTTSVRILDANGEPVSAVSSEGGGGSGSLFSSINHDDNNVYFELANGTVITVAKRSSFYMLIRKAPEQAPFVYGETQTYEVESVGVSKVVVTKPGEWQAAYADNKLTITAPSKDHMSCSDKEGEVSLIYFSANNQSSAVSLKVTVDEDSRGVTVGDDFTVDITEITDKNVFASITPKDNNVTYYVTAYSQEQYESKGGDAGFISETAGMFTYYLQYGLTGYIDMMVHKGAFEYKNPSPITASQKFYLVVVAFNIDYNGKTCTAASDVMKVPFTTRTAIVINTNYRIEVSDISWYGARYVTSPTDDNPYLHGFIKKSELEAAESEQKFMEDYVTKLRNFYRKEFESGMITWADLTSVGSQTIVAPGVTLQGEALQQQTDYYAFAFGCDAGTVTSPLSKTAFRTGKFTASEQVTFNVQTEIDRQDVTVTVTPSNKTVNYLWGVSERSDFSGYGDALSFAADQLFFAKEYALDKGIALEELLSKGDDTYTVRDLKAATGHIVYVYGCTPGGVITTEPTIVEFVTKGTIDEFSVKSYGLGNKGLGRTGGFIVK